MRCLRRLPRLFGWLTLFGCFIIGPLLTQAVAEVVFTSGLASGDVTPTRAILWTRVDRQAQLFAHVARDEQFQHTVAFLPARARLETDFTAQVDVRRLQPATRYYYRFVHFSNDGVQVSPTLGSFRTAPRQRRSADVRFAWSGDSEAALKPFHVLEAARQDNLDFFVYLGDTIYANKPSEVADVDDVAPEDSLPIYRAKYRENRDDSFLQELLASTSTYAIWDDHEVKNDFAGQSVNPTLLAHGLQAFFEYMPIRRSRIEPDRLYRRFRWGKDVELFILDERQYRSGNAQEACLADPFPTLPAQLRQGFGLPASPPDGCLEVLADPRRTMLGMRQKVWLALNLLFSDATFKFIINEVPISQLFISPYDRWEGYLAEREYLLNLIRLFKIRNVIFLTTDLHGSLILDAAPAQSQDPVAKEIVVGPIAHDTIADDLGDLGIQDPTLFAGIIQSDCANLNTFSYGLVEVNSRVNPKEATITLKGQASDAQTNEVDVLGDVLSRGVCQITIQAQ